MRTAVAVGLLLAAAPVAAQSHISVEVDTTTVTVGDRITMHVTVEHAPDARVVWPDSLNLDPFEVLESRVVPTETEGDEARSVVDLTLAAFQLGDLEIPSFDVSVIGGDGGEDVLHTDSLAVHVASVGQDESGDIRGIRGPLSIPMSTLRMVLWLVLPLLAAALLYTIARRLRPPRDHEGRAALGPLSRPPHEVALEALAALEASPLVERGEVKEYHIEVSDILRTYVEGRFRVEALEMTTMEVLAGLEQRGVAKRFRQGLSAFLEQCDMVKFAKVRPAPDQCRQVLELGRRLVLDSMPSAAGPGAHESEESAAEPESEPAVVSGAEGSA